MTPEGPWARVTELFALAPAFVCVLRGSGHVFEFANARFCQLVGRWDVVGRAAAEVFPEPAARRFRDLADRVLASGKPHVVERAPLLLQRALAPTPEERIGDVVLQPIVEPDGSTSGVIVLGVDVTDEVRAREQLAHRDALLRQAERMETVGRLASGVAHDLNNLLTVIAASAAFARAEVPPHGAAAHDLDQIDEASYRAAALTRQLLALTREQAPQLERIDVGDRVASMVRMLRRVIGEDVRIETSLAPGLWPVSADAGQLDQVLLNLALNARDAVPAGGTVRIATANVEIAEAARTRPGLPPGRYVSLVVQDSGVGIAPELLPHVFEPFVTTKAPGKGTGLGLSTVHDIVQQSGGHVYVDSAPGQGATFTVLLPRDEDATPASLPPAVAPPPGAHETVLLVEDDATVRTALARVLTRGGYRVLEAADGNEALRVWRTVQERDSPAESRATSESVRLVLTDLVMPQLGGRQLVERLRAERPDLRVIVMSGHAVDADEGRIALGDARTERFLRKPIRPYELLRLVREVLEAG